MSLKEYRRKRDFKKTSEPSGNKKTKRHAKLMFCVQKHAASHLHYDFRLELEGVLLSWAVPKGPHLDPKTKRLAMRTEDHPLDYGDFEGTIPKGEYGGGTVMLWDTGTWEPLSDPQKDLKKGHLQFNLAGEKLKGKWNLIRLNPRKETDKEAWFLVKGSDAVATTGKKAEITITHPLSVKSGLDLPEIGSKEGVWSAELKKIESAKKTKFPNEVLPQLPTLVDEVPDGEDWVHEIKYDGYRFVVNLKNKKVKFITRNGHDWTKKFSFLAKEVLNLPCDNAILDCEAIVLDENGKSSFHKLQQTLSGEYDGQISLVVLDLVYLNGYDLQHVSLIDRKVALKSLLNNTDSNSLMYSDFIESEGQKFFESACDMGLEGIVSKKKNSNYTSGRTRSWVKVKCINRSEFIIGGYTESDAPGRPFAALLLGEYVGNKFVYTGKVGTGFTKKEQARLIRKFKALEVKKTPYSSTTKQKNVHWLKPVLIAEIEYTERTADGNLRHPSFQGIREDKLPKQVVKEKPTTI